MAYVRVEQRHAHLAGPVLAFVNGREGKVAKAVLTAISNMRRGSGEAREDEPTAIQWTLWARQAENAAEDLGKGSHVNVVGRVRNNNDEKDGQTVYGMAFTAEEIDDLDSRSEAEARRTRGSNGSEGGNGADPKPEAKASPNKGSRQRKPARAEANADAHEDIPL